TPMKARRSAQRVQPPVALLPGVGVQLADHITVVEFQAGHSVDPESDTLRGALDGNGSVPEGDAAVGAGHNEAAFPTEGHRVGAVATDRRPDRLPGRHVPQAAGAVVAAGDNGVAARAESRAADAAV